MTRRHVSKSGINSEEPSEDLKNVSFVASAPGSIGVVRSVHFSGKPEACFSQQKPGSKPERALGSLGVRL